MKQDSAAIEFSERSIVHVESWAAVVSGPAGDQLLRLGACQDETIIPAGLRRRLGAYGRIAVSCGLSLTTEGDSSIVFCSRYGDMELAARLLDDLAQHSPLSPAGFSLSVHNAVPGVMDLARQSRAGHTAIAGGAQSLSAGIIEAWTRLSEAHGGTVSLVYTDCSIRGLYAEFADASFGDMALAMTLAAGTGDGGKAQLALKGRPSTDADNGCLLEPASEELASLMIAILNEQTKQEVLWRSHGLEWTFAAAPDASD